MTDLLQGGVPAVGPLQGIEQRVWPRRASGLRRAADGLKPFLPLSREWLDERLACALAEAEQTGSGFYLNSFAVRRAMAAAARISVDPRSIDRRLRHRVEGAEGDHTIRDRFLGAGDWEGLLDPLDTSSTHQEVREVVEAGLDYRRTGAFRLALERARSGHPLCRNYVALKTPDLVEKYFRSIVELVRSVSEAGIVRRAEYRRVSHIFGNCRIRPPWIEAVESDVGIAVGAVGEIYRFASGKHRMAIAQALNIGSMPVEVRMVHAGWLQRQVEASGLRPVAALERGLQALCQAADRP